MNQIIDYITELNWADNWIVYIITSALILVLAYLILKFLILKVKQFGVLALIVLVLALISYALFTLGAIEFDILSIVGLTDVSDTIQSTVESLSEWVKNVFSLSAANRFVN